MDISILSAFSLFGMDTLSSAIVVTTFMIFPLLAWSIFASIKVNKTYKQYSNIAANSGMTARDVARKILDEEGLQAVDIQPCRGSLTDHYDPRNNTVYLSETTIDSPSVAGIGVAAHEVGHAVQYARKYLPVKVRGAIVPVMGFMSKLMLPLLLINMITLFIIPGSGASNISLIIMIAIYAVNMLFTFVTLPTEFNASSRAKKLLEEHNILNEEELAMTSKVLSAAAMTYVASFIMSFVQLLRLLLILMSRRNN